MRHAPRAFASLLTILPLALIIGLAHGATARQSALEWQLQDSGVEMSLRGLSAVSDRIAWASGSSGTWVRTIDGGASWQHGQIPGAETLGVRDIQAFDELTAVALTIASPGRVYRTHNGGVDWELVFEDDRREVFFNCMDFADDQRGYAVGDPIDGRFLLIETIDGGKNWELLAESQRPEAAEGEAQFAASGTCLQAEGDNIWIGTGGSVARVFHSTDRGRHWSASATPLRQGASSQGVFGLLFWNDGDGIIVGGDYTQEANADQSVSLTNNGGAAWDVASSGPPGGFRSAVVRAPDGGALVTVGPSGSDVSRDDGLGWSPIDGPGFHVVSIAPDGAIWAAGADGRIARLARR